MSAQAKRIFISQSLVPYLIGNPQMKAVVSMDADSHRITSLVSPVSRVFECDVQDSIRGGSFANHTSVLMIFNDNDIERIHDFNESLRNNPFCEMLSSDTALHNTGVAKFYGYDEQGTVINQYLDVQNGEFRMHGYIEDVSITLASDPVDLYLLSRAYAENKLMSYQELLASDYNVIFVDENNHDVDSNARLRQLYSLDNQCPQYPFEKWQEEVMRHDVRMGYNQWVVQKLSAEMTTDALLLGLDDALIAATRSAGTSVFKVKLGVYDAPDSETPVDSRVVFIDGSRSEDSKYLEKLACCQAFLDQSKYYTPVEALTEVISSEVIAVLSGLLDQADSDAIDAVIANHYPECRLWAIHVDEKKPMAAKILLKDFIFMDEKEQKFELSRIAQALVDDQQDASLCRPG